jgi:hypothetical protein
LWRVALVFICACWTGPDPAETLPAPPVRRPPDLVVTMERTTCLGDCPAYTVEIRGDGTILVKSDDSITRGRTTRSRVHQLARAIDAAHFFELDGSGHPPAQAQCVTTGNTTTCSIHSFTLCSDTSHAIITIKRGTRMHTVDDAHCTDDRWLTTLETMIDDIAGTPPQQF